VRVLCGSPVWPSPPVVGSLRGPTLCVGPLRVGPSPVVFPFSVASVTRLASCSRSRSRSQYIYIGLYTILLLPILYGIYYDKGVSGGTIYCALVCAVKWG